MNEEPEGSGKTAGMANIGANVIHLARSIFYCLCLNEEKAWNYLPGESRNVSIDQRNPLQGHVS